MFHIHETISLCDVCYRHVHAQVYENDNKILMTKHCHQHGFKTSVVEVNTDFYHSLKYHHDTELTFNQILFEVTDRCQLNCPHCYHLPNNKITDRSIADIIEQLKQFPKTSMPMMAGAEATLRKDFVELCASISDLNFKEFSVISNGVRFADKKFTRAAFDHGLKQLCFGLNHHSYQGLKIHNKQLRAIDNLIESEYRLGYVGYTIESLDDVEDILKEIERLNHPNIHHYRIRCGSFIGRSSDKERSYLSLLVDKVKSILGPDVVYGDYDNNVYHVMMNWKGILLRLIQWPDVTNIDMEELVTGPWSQFYHGPVTNFVHQVITRDAYKNNGLPMLDQCPDRYHYRPLHDHSTAYWRDTWTGPVQIEKLEWKDHTVGNRKYIYFNQEATLTTR